MTIHRSITFPFVMWNFAAIFYKEPFTVTNDLFINSLLMVSSHIAHDGDSYHIIYSNQCFGVFQSNRFQKRAMKQLFPLNVNLKHYYTLNLQCLC